MDKLKSILEIIEEGMTFTFYETTRERLWTFLEFSGDDIVVKNPDGEIMTKTLDFLKIIKLDVEFLDYNIVNSGNSDGWVITKRSNKPNYKMYECNLGNFSELESAKEYCVRFFMIARPETFAKTICNKIVRTNSGTCHEFYLLKTCLEKENIPIPSEITSVDSYNCMIGFNGKII